MGKTISGVGAPILAIAVVALLALPATATPFKFTFTGTIDPGPAIAGVSGGDTLTIDVIADNGAGSAISQVWNKTDLVSASLSVGTYSATYVDAFTGLDPIFQTDGAGLLNGVNFSGTLDSTINSDILGTGGAVRLFSNAVRDFNGNFAFYTPVSQELSAWTAEPEAIAVPAPGPIAILGLAVFGLWPRRSGQAAC